jgi:hypothetical protein
MRLFRFRYIDQKEYKTVWIPAHSEQCAKYKVRNKNVLTDETGPVIIEVDVKPLSNDWK